VVLSFPFLRIIALVLNSLGRHVPKPVYWIEGKPFEEEVVGMNEDEWRQDVTVLMLWLGGERRLCIRFGSLLVDSVKRRIALLLR
jgi:hypothetical protein